MGFFCFYNRVICAPCFFYQKDHINKYQMAFVDYFRGLAVIAADKPLFSHNSDLLDNVNTIVS